MEAMEMRDHLPHIGTCFMAVPSIRKPLFFRSSGPRINVHHWRLACFFGRARFDDQILWSGSKGFMEPPSVVGVGRVGYWKEPSLLVHEYTLCSFVSVAVPFAWLNFQS